MTGFLLRSIATNDAGDVLLDETSVADLTALVALEQCLVVLGERVRIRIEFDPPLVPQLEAPAE